MKAATILIALFASMASASLRNVQCNGKPPSGWGSPNCNDADKTACKNLCTNGTIKCSNVLPKNGDGYWYAAPHLSSNVIVEALLT
ncbi:hypothetical protein CH63R_06133 [Colletotrichum higginsianum IMI 349063]|uniref:Uncharacterized protein n=1 Tax=Colletotrichum higginsianum (strain IMI 349063) TaxID=759273 RepID=A0A1B7YE66_COLHI|nr:hypothetical protein CH63R_06133 [Colletotrichum higginsianum IMI 349063]OBR10441.1 hypothetical protein CH63R_06133 [Colletotrichum higginsianum IMI 349063]